MEPEAETPAEEPPVDGKGPAGFWNTEEIRPPLLEPLLEKAVFWCVVV